MIMTKLTDETLMRYADGMLDRSEAEQIEQLLALTPRLLGRLQVFRITGSNLRDLFADYMNAPIPARFRELLSQPDPKPGRFRLSTLASQLHSRCFLPERRYGALSTLAVMAAIVVVVAGAIGIGWMLRGVTIGVDTNLDGLVQIQGTRLVAERPLQSTLERLPSGARVPVFLGGKEFHLEVKTTFRDGAGDYCREYEIAAAYSPRYAGLACRRGIHWTVEMHALMPSFHSASGQTIPAGGNANLDMDTFVSALIAGDPLSAEQEAALLSTGWRSE
jgi:hypothetical protein